MKHEISSESKRRDSKKLDISGGQRNREPSNQNAECLFNKDLFPMLRGPKILPAPKYLNLDSFGPDYPVGSGLVGAQ
jgi:hypothetical protein